MKYIEVVSYIHGLSNKVCLKLTTDLINSSTADILLFCGHSIGSVDDIMSLRLSIKNNHTNVVFELRDIKSDKIGNCLYRVSKGIVTSMYTNQIFAQSREIENNYELGRRFLHELDSSRFFNIDGYNVLVLQCGEINILRNIQSENNRVEFRFSDDESLKNQFEKLLSKADIILNPIHTPMGNQGKMEKRRIFFSQGNRFYFSTSNSKEDSSNLELKSLQYAYYNGVPIFEKVKEVDEYYLKRTFEIFKEKVLK